MLRIGAIISASIIILIIKNYSIKQPCMLGPRKSGALNRARWYLNTADHKGRFQCILCIPLYNRSTQHIIAMIDHSVKLTSYKVDQNEIFLATCLYMNMQTRTHAVHHDIIP